MLALRNKIDFWIAVGHLSRLAQHLHVDNREKGAFMLKHIGRKIDRCVLEGTRWAALNPDKYRLAVKNKRNKNPRKAMRACKRAELGGTLTRGNYSLRDNLSYGYGYQVRSVAR